MKYQVGMLLLAVLLLQLTQAEAWRRAATTASWTAMPWAATVAWFAGSGRLEAFAYWNLQHNLLYAGALSGRDVMLRAGGALLPWLLSTAPLVAAALAGAGRAPRPDRLLLGGGALALFGAGLVGGRFFGHYFFPVYMPLSLLAARWLDRRDPGLGPHAKPPGGPRRRCDRVPHEQGVRSRLAAASGLATVTTAMRSFEGGEALRRPRRRDDGHPPVAADAAARDRARVRATSSDALRDGVSCTDSPQSTLGFVAGSSPWFAARHCPSLASGSRRSPASASPSTGRRAFPRTTGSANHKKPIVVLTLE